MPTRRRFTLGLAATALAGAGAYAAGRAFVGRAAAYSTAELSQTAVRAPARDVVVNLMPAPRATALPAFGGPALPLWSFAPGDVFPNVVRMRFGETLVATVENGIPEGQEELTVHWHGVRLPNAEDGVPYLTQKPIPFGARFTYRFTPPDPGTYWFHTHCNTAESIGRGLIGVLIVEGDETRPYDADQLLCLKDWRVGKDGAAGGFLPFLTDSGASKAGTFGALRTVNGAVSPRLALPAGGDVRLRLINVDPTRVPEIGIEGAEAAIVAVDGAGIPPVPFKTWRLGPAMRLDLVVRMPATGGEVRVVDYFAADPVVLSTLVATGETLARGAFDPAPLVRPAIPEPDLAAAERMPFVFSATATGAALGAADGIPFGPLCASEKTFWAINRAPWPNRGHAVLPPPLAELKRGRSYVFELANVTPHVHPIHIHGHTWRVVKSSAGPVIPHFADTVLVAPKERVEVAFVADNPGDWMLHCHIIEHQETGMMGFLRVA